MLTLAAAGAPSPTRTIRRRCEHGTRITCARLHCRPMASPGAPRWFCILLTALLAAPAAFADTPPFDWRPATPASQGLSADRLDTFRDNLAKHGTRALLVIRHDQIVCEWYADGVAPDKIQGTASLAKSLIGGMSLAAAMTANCL